MIESISPTELKARLDANEDILVIDVRMPWELEISSVDFSTNIVLNELPAHIDEIPDDKTIVIICRSGGRSMQACQFLAAQGWDTDKLFNLEGGILAWARDIDDTLPLNY